MAIDSDSSLAGLPFADAFDSVRVELRGLAADELVAVNLDIPGTVLAILGRLPKIRAHGRRLVELPWFDFTAFDKLETYALAMGYAHARCGRVNVSPQAVQRLAGELKTTRRRLLSDARSLAERDLIDGVKLRSLRGKVGFAKIVFDTLLLVTLLRESWSTIEGKCAVELAELIDAEARANELATAMGLQKREPKRAVHLLDLRQRAYTLFFRAYDEVRRGIHYLRWHEGDADRIAPSLYLRGKRKTASKQRGANKRNVASEKVGASIEETATPVPAGD